MDFDEEFDDFDDVEEELEAESVNSVLLTGADRKFDGVMRPHLRTTFIAERAAELREGARSKLKTDLSMTSPERIAELELENKVIPILLKMTHPDGAYEYIGINDIKYVFRV